MPLSDPQLRRYSRQILLRSVGGKGQERLRAAAVRASGAGGAVTNALAYLGAGGTAVTMSAGKVELAQVGFLFGRSDVGRAARQALADSLRALNPDAADAPAADGGELAELPHRFEGRGPYVALGGDGTRAACVYRGDDGCEDCFRAWIEPLSAPPPGALAIGLGALAALVYQRSLLGQEPERLRGWWLERDGVVAPYVGRSCPSCP